MHQLVSGFWFLVLSPCHGVESLHKYNFWFKPETRHTCITGSVMNICYECSMPTLVLAFHGPLTMHMATVIYDVYFVILIPFSISIICERCMLSMNTDGHLLVVLSTACINICYEALSPPVCLPSMDL